MGIGLIIAWREIQINIRNLISIKSKEYGEWNVVSILIQAGAAFRAWLIRKVKPAAYGTIRKEFGPVAFRAYIMRWQRIYFRNARHGRNKGRTYRSSWTYEISAVIRMFNQLMSNEVQYTEPVLDNRFQFWFQPVLYDIRERIPINGFGIVVTHFQQFFVGPGNLRVVRFPFFCQRFQSFTHLPNLPCVVHYYFLCLFRWKVGKFIQHFLCGPQVYRRMGIQLTWLFPGREKDIPVCLIFSEHVMRIRCSAYRYPRLFSDFYNFPVQIL